MNEYKEALTYDDIQLIPGYSEINSRESIDLSSVLIKDKLKLNFPIISSPMPTVTESGMAIGLIGSGGTGVIHRFMEPSAQLNECLLTREYFEEVSSPIPAIGVTKKELDRAKLLIDNNFKILLIDVAHGHHSLVAEMIYHVKKLDNDVKVIAGNIATSEAAKFLESNGADCLRVGIGGGSLCTTRLKTGFGIPNVSCLLDIRSATDLPIIADGGIRNSGDIAKALALGANCVMLGSLLAGTDESPGHLIKKSGSIYKKYAGAASFETKLDNKQPLRNIEGESTYIPYKGPVSRILSEIREDLKSSLSYFGANNLSKFKPKFCKITVSGITEAKPHLL